MFRLGLIQLIVGGALLANVKSADFVSIAGRLPTNVQPELYELTLEVNHERMIFSGNVIITVQVVNATDSIHLHAKSIQVNWRDAILRHNDRSIALLEVNDQGGDIVQLKFRDKLSTNKHSLTVTFSGEIRRDLSGLYSVLLSNNKSGERRQVCFFNNLGQILCETHHFQ